VYSGSMTDVPEEFTAYINKAITVMFIKTCQLNPGGPYTISYHIYPTYTSIRLQISFQVFQPSFSFFPLTPYACHMSRPSHAPRLITLKKLREQYISEDCSVRNFHQYHLTYAFIQIFSSAPHLLTSAL
jgi:hypothetical protein